MRVASILRKLGPITLGASILALLTAFLWPDPTSARAVRRDPAFDAIAAARARAGADAVDCGRASSRNPKSLDACMADAFRAGRAFVGVLDEQGIDSAVGRVYAGTTSRDVRQYHFDSDPSGGGGAAPTVSVVRCSHPVVEEASGGRRIRCENDPSAPDEPGSAVYK